VDKSDAVLRRLERLSGRLTAAEAKAATLRDELYVEMVAAREAGVTLSAMSRALGISRQRVQQIFERLDR
jgi:DNA-directed RNA polymerase sigma subunit (sigma70/sigma32)